MRTRNLTTHLSSLALAVASVACAPRGAAAQDAAPAVTPAAEPAPALDEVRPAAEEARSLRASIRQKETSLRARPLPPSPMPGGPYIVTRVATADAPLILVTRPTEDAAMAEMKEDLIVMDKLVRDEVARAGGEDPQRPWGIKLTMVGQLAPMYVEGGGAVFSAAVDFPLADADGGTTSQREAKPREPDSKWVRAKREVISRGLIATGTPGVELDFVQPPAFEQAKLDALRAAVIRLLPEAANFRHLANNESVFVTIVGTNDAGAPLRMTLKASKADIDAAAAGTIKPEEFAQRVAQRIG